MRKDLIDIVCCPDDKEVLELRDAQEDEHEEVITGTLHCPECGFDFPIEHGIPNLLPKQFHVEGQSDAKKSGQGKRSPAKGRKGGADKGGKGGKDDKGDKGGKDDKGGKGKSDTSGGPNPSDTSGPGAGGEGETAEGHNGDGADAQTAERRGADDADATADDDSEE